MLDGVDESPVTGSTSLTGTTRAGGTPADLRLDFTEADLSESARPPERLADQIELDRDGRPTKSTSSASRSENHGVIEYKGASTTSMASRRSSATASDAR